MICQSPDLSRAERRARRARPPSHIPGATIYRSDGASKRRTSGPYKAGWGAARWTAAGVLASVARGRLPDGTTNNQAEYQGLAVCMENAIERSQQESLVVFEVDSKLVARQMQSFGLGKFACRSDQLRPLYFVCIGFFAATGCKRSSLVYPPYIP